ncbi:hypothetical protein AX14_010893 [Amanita brunnescens Koide BX004]|nr:hypothetical protein AX14_010893 [Amanita brunnescens Koide BX004]
MSFFYNRESFIVSKYALNSKESNEPQDTILIGRNLWNALSREINIPRLCLCLEPVFKVNNVLQHSVLDRVVCWAEPDDRIDNIVVPTSWPTTYKNVFGHGNSTVRITNYEPVPLQEVFMTAFSIHAYELAKVSMPSLEGWLSNNQKILRCGSIYMLDAQNLQGTTLLHRECLYRLDMSMPVLQGYVKSGFTDFVITLSTSTADGIAEPNHSTISNDSDGIEIGEDFLRSSMLRVPMPPVEWKGSLKTFPRESTTSFFPRPWPSGIGHDTTFYVCTSDLVGLGVLDGDWLLARSSDGLKQRLVRIEVEDQIADRTGVIVGSPTLLHNFYCGQVDGDVCPRASDQITLHPIRLGGPEPPVPIAHSITVARIASPSTVNKAYQHIFLQSLKKYFEFRTRLIRYGDIIAVPLDTGEDHLVEKLNELVNGGNKYHDFRTMGLQTNNMAFFRIAGIDCEDGSLAIANDIESIYAQCKSGELGCRVDPAVTRVIQQGIESSRIPSLAGLSGLWHDIHPVLTYRSPFVSSPPDGVYNKLMELVRVTFTRNAMNYNLYLSILLEGSRGVGKFSVAKQVAQHLGIHLMAFNCFEITGETDIETEGTLRFRFEQAISCAPCILVLRHIEALANAADDIDSKNEGLKWSGILQECFEKAAGHWKVVGHPVVIVGMTSEPERVPSSIMSCFKHRFSCKAPSEQERLEVLENLLSNVSTLPDVSLDALATQTAALVPSDLLDLVMHTKLSSLARCFLASIPETAVIPLMSLDFEQALKKSRVSYTKNFGAPKIPKVSWSDVGGLATAKADILDTIRLPLEHPELFADGLKKRSGLLLYGPPGTGKTLIAKAVATSLSVNFLSIKGPELLNMYIGESEANVRRIFQRARDASPCVVFFDELDSIAPKRGYHGDSGGVMDRIVSQLLAELDGMSAAKGNVFVIGATNRPDLLDPALLRPGRQVHTI